MKIFLILFLLSTTMAWEVCKPSHYCGHVIFRDTIPTRRVYNCFCQDGFDCVAAHRLNADIMYGKCLHRRANLVAKRPLLSSFNV